MTTICLQKWTIIAEVSGGTHSNCYLSSPKWKPDQSNSDFPTRVNIVPINFSTTFNICARKAASYVVENIVEVKIKKEGV